MGKIEMNFHLSPQTRVALAAIGGIVFAAIWSGSFVATKIALADIPPLWLAGIRLAAAGLLLSALTLRPTLGLWKSMAPKHRLAVVSSGLLSQAFYLGATYWALVSLPTGVVNIIVAALPLVSVPMAFLVLGETVAVIDVVAAGCGVAGIVIVVIGRDPTVLQATNFLSLPVALTIASVLALAAGNTLVKPYVSLRTIAPTCAIQMTLSSLVILSLAAYHDGHVGLTLSVPSLTALAYLIFIGSIVGTFVWYKVLETFTAKGASMFFLFTPIFGLAIGWMLLGEAMTFPKLLGAGVVSGSILLRYGFYWTKNRVVAPA